jgi:hypothetical protein
VWLTTSYEAPVNEHRDAAIKIARKRGASREEWRAFLTDLIEEYAPIHRDNRIEPIVFLLGDAVDDSELRRIFAWLLDNTEDIVRATARKFGFTGKASSIAQKLDRAQLLQLMLLAKDDSITHALDLLIRDSDIRIPPGEVRRPVVNGLATIGPYHLRAEANRLGVRTVWSRRCTLSATIKTARSWGGS